MIALVIGHGPKIDKGAQNADGSVTELEYNTQLVAGIAERMKTDHTVIHRQVEKNPPVTQVNALFNCVAALEFHLNAFDGKATGIEMLHSGGTNSIRLAGSMLTAGHDVLQITNRGLKNHASGRGGAFLTRTNPPACIVESFFIDNPHDLAIGLERMGQLAAAYASALDAWNKAST